MSYVTPTSVCDVTHDCETETLLGPLSLSALTGDFLTYNDQ